MANPFPAIPVQLQRSVNARSTQSVTELVQEARTQGITDANNAEALERLQTQADGVNLIQKQFLSFLQSLVGVNLAVNLTPLEVHLASLVTTTVTTAYPQTPGDRLVVFAKQSSFGSGAIAWDVMFKFTSTSITTTANTTSVFDFVGRVDSADGRVKWYAANQFITGQT